jgi:hypothetical protein
MTIENGHEDFSDGRDESVQTGGPASAGTAFAQVYAFDQAVRGPEDSPEPGATVPGDGQPAGALAYGPVSGDGTAEDALPGGLAGNGDALSEREGNGEAPAMQFPDHRSGKLSNFTRPASDIINKARRIARELNHASVSAAHLALALTLDPRSSRRLRDQGVDVDLVREAAVRTLAKFNFMYASGAAAAAELRASPDLADIREAAMRFAQERDDEEEINISDLLDAFRKSGSGAKLIYGVQEAPDQVPAVLRRVEQGVAQQLEQLFAEMQRRLQAAPQFEQLFAEVERRLEAFSDMEQRLLARNEERVGALLEAASAQLSQQLSELRNLRGEMIGQIDALSKANAKNEDRGWFR